MINSHNNATNEIESDSKVVGFCESIMQSMKAITSIYKDSGYIISVLKNDPYSSKYKWSMTKLVVIRFLWLIIAIGMELAVSFPFSWIMTSLQHKSSHDFKEGIKYYLLVIIIAGPVLAIDHYLTDKLYVYFRQATTEILLNRYHSNNNYYHISSSESVDNPGQRLDQDVDNWSWGLIKFCCLLIRQFLRLLGWCMVLWYIGAELIVYGFLVAVILVVFSIVIFASKLTYIAFLLSKHSADFRAGVIRTRDNGETIAFYGASDFERYWNNQRFKKLVNTLLLQAQWSSGLEFMTQITKYIGTILPLLLLASSYMQGNLTLGSVMQSCYAFGELLLALTIVVSQMNRLSGIQAGGSRIAAVIVAMEKIDERITSPPTIAGDIIGSPRSVRHSNGNNHEPGYLHHAGAETAVYDGIKIIEIAIEEPQSSLQQTDNTPNGDEKQDDNDRQIFLLTDNLSVIVPNTHSLLLYKLNMEISRNQNIIIIGPSGAGKSSLLRVLCGLWKWGAGNVHRLKDENVMFLPQRPYLPILCEGKNTLKNQLLFPKLNNMEGGEQENNGFNNEELTNRKFHRILESINLEYILDYEHNAASDSHDWSKLLSLGEQQRLSFGRVLVDKPEMVFLDEATSALDVENQNQMYRLMQKENITYLSVGHRTGLIEYHDTILQVIGDGSWKLWSTEQYLQHQHNQDQNDQDSF